MYRVFGQLGWSKAEIDNADFWELIDIMESGEKKGAVPLDQLNVESMDFDQMKQDLQESGKWPTSS